MDDKNGAAPHRFIKGRLKFAIAKYRNVGFPKRNAKTIGNSFREIPGAATGKELNVVLAVHFRNFFLLMPANVLILPDPFNLFGLG